MFRRVYTPNILNESVFKIIMYEIFFKKNIISDFSNF